MADSGKRKRRFSLALVFVLAVLGPSVALSLLALRAASRETLFVERRLESTLLAEVNHAATRVVESLERVKGELAVEAERLKPDEGSLARWKTRDPLVAVPFSLREGKVTVSDAWSAEGQAFLAAFAPFLEGEAELPAYDDIANVYRKQMKDEALDEGYAVTRSVASLSDVLGGLSKREAPVAVQTVDQDENKRKTASDFEMESVPAPLEKEPEESGVAKQMAASLLKNDTALQEETYKKAAEEGFQMLQRNVMPQAAVQQPMNLPGEMNAERSKTVARGRSFGDLLREGRAGLLPRLSEEGLEILFWARGRNEDVVGCTLNMDVLRERLVGALPEVLSDVRILTVLNERGEPVFAPQSVATPEWRKPFVAREISPLLPRWEIGAWLTDPGMAASQARVVNLAVGLLVTTLLVAIGTGGTVVLRTLSAEMRLAQQKTTFVANVSHELKTPLTSIRLFAEMLLQRRQPDEKKREDYLRTMVSEAERLSRLVDNVLTFSRRGAGNNDAVMESLDLAELARETAEQLRPHLAMHGFSLRVSAPEHLWMRGHGEGLQQVLMNLLSNAEKYSDDVRQVDVVVRAEEDAALVEVADRGVGVPPGQEAKIFEEFYRCDDSLTSTRRGTGLGLPIARDIARKHGGDVICEPRDGGGSIFTLRLPLKPVGKGASA